jgi:lysophospholipase L1-like esterase
LSDRLEVDLRILVIRIVSVLFCSFSILSAGLPANAKDTQSAKANPADTRTAPPQSSRTEGKASRKSHKPADDRFENDIRAFEQKDAAQPPKPGCTVFVGSSTFTLWKGLEQSFSEFRALNRGFGGSTFPDINHYVGRIVTKYKPGKVVLYAGTNDIAELHHSGAEIAQDFKTFVRLVLTDLPRAEIYYVSMSMAPCRIQWSAEYEKGNSLIHDFISPCPHLHYIDVLPVMRKQKGELRADLFGPDHLHMNPEGYALWTPIIRKALQSQ